MYMHTSKKRILNFFFVFLLLNFFFFQFSSCCVDPTGLKLHPPAIASSMLGLKVCATMSSNNTVELMSFS